MKLFNLENFLLIRTSDLQAVSNIKGKTKWFEGNRFWIYVISSIFCAVVLLTVLIWTVINHHININNLKKEHKLEYENQVVLNDSLCNVLEDISREDSIMHRLYECFLEPCKPITHDRLWEFILSCDPWYPDIIMMQAVQESSCGKSEVAKRCNNLFGMTKPVSRKWKCDINRNNKKESFAEFLDWRFSVIDRIFWERWVFRNSERKPTLEEYMRAIDNVYNTETEGYGDHIYRNAAKYRKLIK